MQRATISMFAQLVQSMGCKLEFQHLVNKHQSDKASKGFSSWSQFIAMLFCQLTGAESLKEISDGLFSSLGKLNHIGAKAACRSTLGYVNQNRPYKLYEDFYYVLPDKFRHEIQGRLSERFTKPVYSLDSTTISLCLRLFEWAHHRRRKGGIKLHTLLNNDLCLPEVIVETPAKVSDIKGAKSILENIPKVSIVVMDRGYNDYSLFKRLSEKGVTFVTRLKDNAVHTPLRKGLIQEDPDKKWGLYEMSFTGTQARKHCEDMRFRVVQWYDEKTDRWFEFLTNSKELTAPEVADLYKERWQIELFFKRIKQNLVIKSFIGTTENAVMTQIWTAAIAILLLELLRRRSRYNWTFCRLARYFKLNLMTCKSLEHWLNKPDIKGWESPPESSQGCLFSWRGG